MSSYAAVGDSVEAGCGDLGDDDLDNLLSEALDDEDADGRLAKVSLLDRAAQSDKDGTLLEEINSCLTERSFSEGEVLMTRGEPGTEMYFLLEGELAVHLDMDAPPVAKLTAGDIVGEGALLSDDVRSAHVVAMTDALVMVLTKQALTELVPRFPALEEEMKEKEKKWKFVRSRRAKIADMDDAHLLPAPDWFATDGWRMSVMRQAVPAAVLMVVGGACPVVCELAHAFCEPEELRMNHPDTRTASLFLALGLAAFWACVTSALCVSRHQYL